MNMKRILLFYIVIALSHTSHAQTNNISKQETLKQLKAIEEERQVIFNQYQKDKANLDQEYDYRMDKLDKLDEEQRRIEKKKIIESISDRRASLLDTYRKEMLRLTNEKDKLRGRDLPRNQDGTIRRTMPPGYNYNKEREKYLDEEKKHTPPKHQPQSLPKQEKTGNYGTKKHKSHKSFGAKSYYKGS